jgi:hypothetical protein
VGDHVGIPGVVLILPPLPILRNRIHNCTVSTHSDPHLVLTSRLLLGPIRLTSKFVGGLQYRTSCSSCLSVKRFFLCSVIINYALYSASQVSQDSEFTSGFGFIRKLSLQSICFLFSYIYLAAPFLIAVPFYYVCLIIHGPPVPTYQSCGCHEFIVALLST